MQTGNFSRLSLAGIDKHKVLECGLYEIQPAVASTILANRNSSNRSLAPAKVAQTCDDIRAGRFLVNGESIIFSNTGELLDGQHRLTACVQTNLPIISVVVFGVHNDAKRTIDTGKGRTVGDVARIAEGICNANTITSIARLMIAYERGTSGRLATTRFISVGEILEFIERTPEIHDISRWSNTFAKYLRGVMPTSLLAVCRMILEPAYGQNIIPYLEQVGSGENIQNGDPAFAVRRRLLGPKHKNSVSIEAVLRGAVAYHEGRTLSRVDIHNRFPTLD